MATSPTPIAKAQPLTTIARVHTNSRDINQLQNNFIVGLYPLTTQAFLFGNILTNVALVSGTNTINHGLGKILSGWVPVRVRASATFYDMQDTNTKPGTTLIIVASAAATVDFWVF